MALKRIHWTEELFTKVIKTAGEKSIIRKIRAGESGEIINILLNRTYPLYKDLFGVKIEYGSIRFVKLITRDIVLFLEDYVELYGERGEYSFKPSDDLDRLSELCGKFGLEMPDRSVIEGYILNNELVHFVLNDGCHTLVLKYKDSPQNIFYLYKFYFADIRGEFFLIIEKNI